MNLEVLEHIKRLPLSFFDKIDIVYLNQRINNDVITLVNFIFDNLFKVFITTISLIVYIILITNISYISSIIILALLVSSLILYKIFHKKIYNTTFKYKEEQNQYFSAMNLQIENIKYIKTNSMYEYLTNKLKYKFNKLYFHTKKYAFISYMYVSIDSLISYGGNVLIYLVGGILFLHGNLTIGSIIIILSYFSKCLNSISDFLEFGQAYQETNVAFERLQKLFNTHEEINGLKVVNTINDISLNNLNIRYENKIILNNFNYIFKKNSIYLIKGENGTGKSSLINCIIGIRNNYDGNIEINNTEIKYLNMYKIRKNLFSIVEQEPIILAENLDEYFEKNDILNDPQIHNLANILKIKNIINSNVSLNYKNLSGGEKQKLSIMKALYENKEILIFDEPTSAMDKDGIKHFKKLITKLKNDKIVIIITHDASLDVIGDKIIDLTKYTFNINTPVS